MKQVKRNKQKVWRKTYGKPFIARKAIVIAQMASHAATASAEINVILHASTDKFQKGLAVAAKLIEQAKNMADQSKLLNKGFVGNIFNEIDRINSSGVDIGADDYQCNLKGIVSNERTNKKD